MSILTKEPTSSFAGAVFDGLGAKPDGDTNKAFDRKLPGETADDPNKGAGDAAAKAASEAKAAEEKAKSDAAAAEAAKGAVVDDPNKGKSAANPNLSAGEGKTVEAEVVRPKGMDDKAFVKWKDLHAAAKERDTLKSEVATLKEKLEAAGKPNPEHELTKKELEALKTKFSEYEGEISVTRVEATADFKKNVTTPRKDIVTAIGEIAKGYDVPPEGLLAAIQEPDRAKRAEKLEEAITDLKKVDQEEIVQMARDWARTEKLAAEYRTDASKKLEEIERQSKGETEREASENRASYQSAAMQAWNRRLESSATVKRVDGQDAWNAILDAAGKKISEIDVNNLDLEDVADMASAREIVPHLEESVKFFQKENKRLADELKAEKARNAAFIAQSPAAGGGHGGGVDAVGNGSKAGRRLAETMPAGIGR